MTDVVFCSIGNCLVLEFWFMRQRCREHTGLFKSKRNWLLAKQLGRKVQRAIDDGTFRYAEFFPHSENALWFERAEHSLCQIREKQDLSEVVHASHWFRNVSIEERSLITSVLNSLGLNLIDIGCIDSQHLNCFCIELGKARCKNGWQYSAQYINEKMHALQTTLADATDTLNVTPNFSDFLAHNDPVQPDDVPALLMHVPFYLLPLVTVAVYSGLIGECLLDLRWEQVDFKRELLFPKQGLSANRHCSHFAIPLGAMRQQLVALYQKSSSNPYVFSKVRGFEKPGQLLKSLNTGWISALNKCKLRTRRFNQCLTTAVLLWLRNGVSRRAIQQRLGGSFASVSEFCDAYLLVQSGMAHSHESTQLVFKEVGYDHH